MRTFFSFHGGKWRIAPRYPAPEHDLVVEPFAGSAGYALRRDARRVILVEKDPTIAGVWEYLIRASPSEILALPDLEPGQSVDDFSLPQEARWLIGFWLNKGARRPRKTASSWVRSGIRPNSTWGLEVRRRIVRQLDGIREWKITEGSYEEAPNVRATWFIDPPYEGTSEYRYREIDYEALATWCKRRRGQVIVCERPGATWLPFRLLYVAKGQRGKSPESVWVRGENLSLGRHEDLGLAHWVRVHKGSRAAAQIADNHYSRRKPGAPQFMPPGQTIVLLSKTVDALFGWWRPAPSSGIESMNGLDGWTCTVFRNAGETLSSVLILEAEVALHRISPSCGPDGMLTYVAPSKIRSSNPGYCFKKAGWRRMGLSADGRKLLFQKPFELAGKGG